MSAPDRPIGDTDPPVCERRMGPRCGAFGGSCGVILCLEFSP
ncbi:hypothetical protein VITFI_CDS2895 [Vitreoscilla filiformis]|uniref:Uncharacterized protein n=1 Tax=Vitreoscilla filiformis TaxID=63 RepID=A0A221KHZ8_VITFI|nr:hypothetical protein VITFI_CDS2895 [Vitreoscilla filiformis]